RVPQPRLRNHARAARPGRARRRRLRARRRARCAALGGYRGLAAVGHRRRRALALLGRNDRCHARRRTGIPARRRSRPRARRRPARTDRGRRRQPRRSLRVPARLAPHRARRRARRAACAQDRTVPRGLPACHPEVPRQERMMSSSYFADIAPIRYEGPDTDNELAYRWYDKDRVVAGKRMEDHLRFAVCFWHTFCWPGSDIFGAGTFERPWHAGANDNAAARAKREAAFDFFTRLDVPFYCFHDVDVMGEAHSVAEHRRNLAEAVDHLEALQGETGRRLLWGTANLFSHPRYAGGAATSPDPEVFAWAAMQVRDVLEATHRLGGANYVLWGGREGYDTLHNTDLRRELDNFGRFLNLVVEHKHKIGFTGTILIEPKPHEPTKHQYDFDTATEYGFLKRYGLENEAKVNSEANHATLAGHTCVHELATAAALGIIGSIDANRGDHQNGWDTVQFPNSVEELTVAMIEVLRVG